MFTNPDPEIYPFDVEHVTSIERIDYILNKIEDRTGEIALDFETTGLDPLDGADVTVASIMPILPKPLNEPVVYVIDLCAAELDWRSFVERLSTSFLNWVVNSKFEIKFFDDACGDMLSEVYDVLNLVRACRGGFNLPLGAVVRREFNVSIPKDLGKSDWSKGIQTDAQLYYAAADAYYAAQLYYKYMPKVTPEIWNGFLTIDDSTRAIIECEDTGLLVDEEHHNKLVAMWRLRRDTLKRALLRLMDGTVENVNSNYQFTDAFRAHLDKKIIEAWPTTPKGRLLDMSRKYLRQLSYEIRGSELSRVLAVKMAYVRANKYLSTYGTAVQERQQEEGRVYSRVNIGAAITGRLSSNDINEQNLPRAPIVRRAFIAGKGKKLCIADYKGIEIRVLAELSDDATLLHDAIYDDVHKQSALQIFQEELTALNCAQEHQIVEALKAGDPAVKELRARAKSFTFQNTYGAMANALSVVLRCSKAEAEQAIKRWAARYSNAYNYRYEIEAGMRADGYIPVKSGRRIFVPYPDRSLPVAANYPVQGSAADVMYRALYHTHQLIHNNGLHPAVRLMATVHDELLLLCDEDYAHLGKQCMDVGMVRGWLDVFPGTDTTNLIEDGATICDNWAGKK